MEFEDGLAQENLFKTSCMICFDIFRPPVRTLPCGHNYCHVCLDDVCEEHLLYCRPCKLGYELGAERVFVLPRNKELERAAKLVRKEMYNNTQSPSNRFKRSNAYRNKLPRLYDLSQSYLDAGKHKEACFVLSVIAEHEDSVKYIVVKFQELECYATKMAMFEEAKATASKILREIDDYYYTSEDITVEDGIEMLGSMFRWLLKWNDVELLLEILEERHRIAKHHCSKHKRLTQYAQIASSISMLADHLQSQKISDQFKRCYPMMDWILDEMQEINDVDLHQKVRATAHVLHHYGYSYCRENNFTKAVETNNKAISLMDTDLIDEARRNKTLGICYNNLAIAYSNLHQYDEATTYFRKSMEVFSSKALDFKDEKSKTETIGSAKANWDRLNVLFPSKV